MRLKLDSNETQSRLEWDLNKTQMRLKWDSNETQTRLKRDSIWAICFRVKKYFTLIVSNEKFGVPKCRKIFCVLRNPNSILRQLSM